VSGDRGDRGDVDDRPAVRHERGERLDPEEGSAEVDRQDAVEVVEGHVAEPLSMRDRGIVDEPVQRAVLLLQPIGQRRPVVGRRDIEVAVLHPVDPATGSRTSTPMTVAPSRWSARASTAPCPCARPRDDHDLSGRTAGASRLLRVSGHASG
jgi:hypothetical protein